MKSKIAGLKVLGNGCRKLRNLETGTSVAAEINPITQSYSVSYNGLVDSTTGALGCPWTAAQDLWYSDRRGPGETRGMENRSMILVLHGKNGAR